MFRTIPEARVIVHNCLQNAVARTLDNLAEDGVKQEPQITERLMSRIEDGIRDIDLEGVQFRSFTFSDRGRNSEESRFGADFAGFLSLTYTDAKVVKVFLSQAKLGIDSGVLSFDNLSVQERFRLLGQIDDMLALTPESYVTVYTKSGIKFLPALSIKNVTANHDSKFWHEIGRYVPVIDAVSFYDQHFDCYIGDTNIERKVNFPINSIENLKRALDIFRTRSGQSILATINRPFTRTIEDQRG